MPRAGLSSQDVVTAAAELADEAGYKELTMGLVAQRLGIRTPSLYKHVDDLADLRHRVATQAMTELGDAIRDALQGRSGLDALTAMLTTIRTYVTVHPGRYAATTGAQFTGPDDPLLTATSRLLAPLPRCCAGTASATPRWTTPSAPCAAPSTDTPPCKPRMASSGTQTPMRPSTG